MTALAIIIPPLSFCLVFVKVDLFYLIHVVFWNSSSVLFCSSNLFNVETFIRVALSSAFFMVSAELVAISIYIFSLILFHIRNYCHTLNNLDDRFADKLILKYYFRVLVFIRHAEQFISDLMSYLIIFGQIYLTLLAWMFINCSNTLPPFILACCGTCFFGGLILSVLILRLAVYAAIYSSDLVENKRAQFFGCNRIKRQYYYTVKWKACKAVSISFGSLFNISKDVITIYVEVLSANITDAVLLIIP